MKYHTVFLAELAEGLLVLDDLPATSPATPGGHHMLEVVSRHCNETPGSVLSVRTLAGFWGQYYADVFTASATPTEMNTMLKSRG